MTLTFKNFTIIILDTYFLLLFDQVSLMLEENYFFVIWLVLMLVNLSLDVLVKCRHSSFGLPC